MARRRRGRQREVRREGVRNQNETILIICEGNKTERIYFNDLRLHGSYNVKIICPNTNVQDPVNLIKEAIIKKDEYDISIEDGDSVWCLFDRDNNLQEQIQKALKESKKHDIKILFSNPSFELWYLLHFDYTTAYLENRTLLQRLSQYISSYSKSESYYNKLNSYQKQAIDNAKKLFNYHKEEGRELYHINTNPITNVYEIIEYLENVSQRTR
jgi:RloB-like protein